MNRRQFIAAGAAAASVATVARRAGAAPLPGLPAPVTRVSCEAGDPGEIAYGKLCGDGKKVLAFLDGIEQKHAVTADSEEGFVLRTVTTDLGNVAFNKATGEVLRETVRGRVEIRVID